MKQTDRNIKLLILFVPVVVGLSLVYDYPETLLKRPQSIHNWRQCDGASLALNYYQEGMHFFKPQTHMLYSDGHTTGYTSPSEIPLLYYFVALLYKIFGYHEYIFRALNLLIFYIGLFYLFKLADSILKDLFYSMVVTVLLFSAPVLVYYANNFMPNTVALSFSFIGWYHFYSYSINKRFRTFLLSMLFFGIAGAMKITELTGPIIVLALVTADRLHFFNLDLNSKDRFGWKITSILMIFVVVAAWIMYAKYYNGLHGSLQFSTYTFPIWVMGKEEIKEILHLMNVLWIKDYFYTPTLWFMVACLVFMVILRKRSDRVLFPVSLFILAALIAFSLLWFQALGHHDYFFIGFYVLPALLFINFFLVLKSFRLGKLFDRVIRVVFVLLVTINIIHAQDRHSLRYYHSWMNDFDQVKDLYTLKPWLKETGFTSEDTIIYYPSLYIRPLYLMDLKGWVIYNHNEVNREIETRDSLLMKKFSENGADYFITGDLKSAAAYKPFEPYMKDLYAYHNRIFIFRLPARNANFNRADTMNIDSLLTLRLNEQK